MRATLWMVPLALALGCGEKSDDTGPSGGDDTGPSGTDDSGGGDDSAVEEGLNGRYTGSALFDIQEANSGQTDQCRGELAIDVNLENSNEQFFGDFQCNFEGFLAEQNPMQGSVYGLISDFGELAASYETGDGPIRGDWSGTIDEGTGIFGSFEGSGSAGGFELNWTGEFRAEK